MSVKNLVDWLVALTVRIVLCVIQASRIESCETFARWIARFAYRVNRRHREVALDNLRRAFPGRFDDAELHQIVRSVYEHFATLIFEIAHIPRKLNERNWRRHVRLQSHQQIVAELLRDQPVILQTAHFGNWEVAGYVMALFGFKPHSVARSLDNPHLERLLRSFRIRTGQEIIYKRGAFDQVDSVMRRNSLVAFLSDQDAGPKGIFVEYFGRPASTHKGVALLSVKHQAPVVIGFGRRIGPGLQYEMFVETVLHPRDVPPGADAVRWLTQQAARAIERTVRQSPEQYLWLHRRWKHQPPALQPASAQAA